MRTEDRIIRLEKLLADFKRALYGAKSEKGHPDQYHLALEDIETAMAVVHAEDEAIDPSKTTAAAKSRARRGGLPKQLPRIEEIIVRPKPFRQTHHRSIPSEHYRTASVRGRAVTP